MKSEFRKQIDRYVTETEDGTKVVDFDEVNSIICTIESDVNEIKDELEKYNVFSEINDIYKLLDTLSDKLY
jgi:hypothetical protein